MECKQGKLFCRCCFVKGSYASYDASATAVIDSISTDIMPHDSYKNMLRNALNIDMTPPQCDNAFKAYTICYECIQKLYDAVQFKRQVETCEEKFKQMYDSVVTCLTNNELKLEITADEDQGVGETDAAAVKTEVLTDEGETNNDSDSNASDKYFDSDFEAKGADVDKVNVEKLRKAKMEMSSKKRKRSKSDSSSDYIAKEVDVAMSKKRPKARMSTRSKKINRREDESSSETEDTEWEGTKNKRSDESATPERVEHRVNLTAILQNSNASPFRNKTMKGFSCLYCAKHFSIIDELRTHTAQQTEKNKLESMLDYKLSCNPIKIDITNLKCTVCDTQLKDLSDLKDHLVATHNKTIYRDIKDIILPFRLEDGHNFSCVICSVVHISFKNLYQHMSSHYRNYCCKKCDAGHITIAALRKHDKTHYQGDFPCRYCEKTYTSITKKRNHEKGVHEGGWLRNKCPHCPEIFVSYYDRNEHLVKVHNKTPVVYPCNACNKIYKKKYALTRHISHHHLQQKSFLCDMCNANFFSKRGLVDHLMKHSANEILHPCDVCGKGFSRLRTLKDHMKVHDKSKKLQCEMCKKSFVSKSSLRVHMRLHQDLDIFKEFDDVKHLIDDRELTLKEIAEENKKK